MNGTWSDLAEKALRDEVLNKDEALAVLSAPDEDVPAIIAAASEVRRRHFGRRVKLNYLVNVKSGLCPEDCHYCSQSKLSTAEIEKYPLMSNEEIVRHVERGLEMGARRACLVASGRGPSQRELTSFCQAVEELKRRHPSVEVCACLGLLKDGQPEDLKESGVHAYNHNLNTSESHYEKICATHVYRDRLDTVDRAKQAGLSACSGVLSGMGETDDDLVSIAFALRREEVDSIPINFLIALGGTPMAEHNQLTPLRCLKILAMFRFVNPRPEIRIAGGREVHLRHLQPLGLMIANSIFIGDYLTTQGQSPRTDLEMIRDLGYEIEGQAPDFLNRLLGVPAPGAALTSERPRDLAPV